MSGRRRRGRPVRTLVVLAPLLLLMLLVGCSPPAPAISGLTISGGGTTGIYYKYATFLGPQLASALDVEVEIRETGGAVENLLQLRSGESDLGFATADTVADAMAGRAPFEEPFAPVALAHLYDENIHLVTLRSSDIRAVADLEGRTVSLGAPGSGTSVVATRILEALGTRPADLTDLGLGIDSSVDALATGAIDAFFWSGGVPTPGITALATTHDLRLVPLDGAVEPLRAQYGDVYRLGTLPVGTYGLEESVATVAVPNYLLSRTDLPDTVAEDVVATIFAAQAAGLSELPALVQLDLHRAIFTSPADLHPGAMDYYRSREP